MGTICLPSANDNATFEVTNTTLHLLQMKGLYGGLAHEDPYKHMTNFIDVCNHFSFKNVPQDLILPRLFPQTEEASLWLAKLPMYSITLWVSLSRHLM